MPFTLNPGSERKKQVPDVNIIYLLAGATLLIAVAIGLYQLKRTRDAKRNHEHSAVTDSGEARRKTQF